MLSLFRRNLFLNLIFLLLFAVALHAYYFVLGESSQVVWPFPTLENLLGFCSANPYIGIISALLLITFQGYLLNDIIIKNKISRVLSTIPGAVFVLFAVMILESEVIHSILFANLFCLFSIKSLFSIYKKHLPISTIFNSGFFMSIAALIYPPYILFLFVLFFGLLSLRNLEIREILQLISGALAPLFLYGVYLNLYDMAHLIPNHFVQNLTIPSLDITAEGAYDSVIKIWLKPLLFILTIFMAIASHNSIKKKKKFDAIKKIELSYWMLFVSILSIFFINPISEKHLLILSIPLAIVSGLVMEGNKNRVVKEFVFLLLIATCVAFQLQII